MQSATVEQPDPQKEDVNSTACDYDLLKGVVLDQENLHRVRSVSCHGTSKATEDSYHLQVAVVYFIIFSACVYWLQLLFQVQLVVRSLLLQTLIERIKSRIPVSYKQGDIQTNNYVNKILSCVFW